MSFDLQNKVIKTNRGQSVWENYNSLSILHILVVGELTLFV